MPKITLRVGDYPVYLWLGTNNYDPYDVVDDLIMPLLIRTTKTTQQLGYDKSKPSGYFDLQSQIINVKNDFHER
jgi:hypothetical protein